MRSSLLLLTLTTAASLARADAPRPARTSMVLMRDGIRLATDIYLPPDATEAPVPCLLVRTPYGRTRYDREFGSMASWGYAVAVQDTRGRFDSEGEAWGFDASGWRTQQDGYDTVQWLAAQDFCDGQVATLGASAMGIDQLLLAPTAPPALRCQYVLVAAPSLYHHSTFVGGVLREDQVTRWLEGNAREGALARARGRPLFDDYWREMDSRTQASRVRVPALHYGGWYDTFSQGTIDSFLAWQLDGGEGARGRQKLVVGPWTHGGPGKTEFGDFELPEAARRVPWNVSARRWFDRHLRARRPTTGTARGADELPAVMYYVLGPLDGSSSLGNEWRSCDGWPPRSRPVSLWLAPSGGLSPVALDERDAISYAYDPADPVPTLGGRNLFLDAGPRDQRAIERRPDVLVFTSAPRERPLEIAGRLRADVFVSAPCGEGDVALRLCDVYPDGRSILLADGIRHWRSARPREPARVAVDLWSLAAVIAPEHRVRLSVASSNHPRWAAWSPPAADDGSARAVRVTVHIGGATGSRLVLPAVDGAPSDRAP